MEIKSNEKYMKENKNNGGQCVLMFIAVKHSNANAVAAMVKIN